ncbi:MAG TPA: PPC domain-containing DNA-binding protein [Flavitalea sp.]|nr:PPC domain-containing DNA-binding protein [Flavitalea sp.]
MQSSSMTTHIFRLLPGQDLRQEIEFFVSENNIGAGCVLTCVGSLTGYNIRFANQAAGSTGSGHFEIIHLSGTISANGCHLHIAISDQNGNMIAGHLLPGNMIYTTAEIVIGELAGLEFKRIYFPATGWKELQITRK